MKWHFSSSCPETIVKAQPRCSISSTVPLCWLRFSCSCQYTIYTVPRTDAQEDTHKLYNKDNKTNIAITHGQVSEKEYIQYVHWQQDSTVTLSCWAGLSHSDTTRQGTAVCPGSWTGIFVPVGAWAGGADDGTTEYLHLGICRPPPRTVTEVMLASLCGVVSAV